MCLPTQKVYGFGSLCRASVLGLRSASRLVLLALLWHATMPVSCVALPSGTVALPYDEQLLQAAERCQFGLYATGSSGAVMQSHAAIAVSTYMALSVSVQLPLATGVMQTIGCASESVDGFLDTFKTTLAQGEPFPDQFFVSNPNRSPRAGVPKSDYGQTHTRGTLKGLSGDIFTRYTAMVCLNATAGAGAACQHRTLIACANSSQFINFLAAVPDPDPSQLLKQPGGCFQLAMEWRMLGGESAWTNVMPHEIWKGLVAEDTVSGQALNQALIGSLTPSYKARSIATENPLLTHLPACDNHDAYLARTQAIANLQAFQAISTVAPPTSTKGPVEGFTWQLLQVPEATELVATLTMRACQYLNATASPLKLCPLSGTEVQGLSAVSPRPTGRFCFVDSSARASHVLQEAATKTNALVAGVASETGLASAMFDLQTAALIKFPATSFTTLLLAMSGAAVSIVTCEKDQIRVGIQKLTKRALRLASMSVCTRLVSKERMQTAVSLAVYGGVALTIAGPGIAIVVTNIQYSKAFLTATVQGSSGHVIDAPQLEITLTETVKLLYKPTNFVMSIVFGLAQCALSFVWGISRGLRAARQPVGADSADSSQRLQAFSVQLSDVQLKHLSQAAAGTGPSLKVNSAYY